MADYCETSDLYDYGLPRGAIATAARLVSSALASTDQFILNEHGFQTDDPVVFREDDSEGATLPGGIVAGTEYYAIRDSDSAFRVAATVGGSAITLSFDGVRVLVVARLPVAKTITGISALIDDMLPGHLVPLSAPYPEIVRMTCAELVTAKLMARQGIRSESFAEVQKEARIRLQRWASGIPIRGENSPTRASLAATRARNDSRGWSQHGGIG